jgi:nitrate/TMAO reductase-like tetraheme cytochrome c subunit
MKLPHLFGKKKFRWPRINLDLNLPAHRWKLLAIVAVFFVVGIGLLVGGVQGYTYSESVEFCGSVCHSMYPQLERYEESAHSHVECTKCHIGPGLQPFIQSKIDGTRQLIGTITNNYSRPIKSPVHNLRPARETCEGCHTPTSFKDNKVKVINHYDSDKQNTPIETTLILKMGGMNALTGQSKGIHWHVNSEVSYIALDDQRQTIAWVGIKQPDGSMKEFYSRDLVGMGQTAFVEEARANGKIRTIDCIDCHNRTAHYIPYPEQSVDTAIENGFISTDLPYIRKKAVEILSNTFESEEEAFAEIDKLENDYKLSPQADVKQAIDTLKELYSSTNFPDMKLNWETNPNNERHTPTAGCFRCHDGNHITNKGDGAEEVISVECNLCHTVPIVGRGTEMIMDAPVIVGEVPESHKDFRWTIEHRNVTDAEGQGCYNCHGQSFCNNGACHNLSHPEDMAFTHPDEVKAKGVQVCYTCHQDVTCTRCHPGGIGIVNNP